MDLTDQQLDADRPEILIKVSYEPWNKSGRINLLLRNNLSTRDLYFTVEPFEQHVEIA